MTIFKYFIGSLIVSLLYACSAYEVKSNADPVEVPLFGSKADIAYADNIWRVMQAERMIG